MKLRIQHILVGVVMLLVGACARVEIVPSPEKDRVPLSEFNLGYQIDRAEVYTKADDEVIYENRVVNLYVMLFKEDGSLIHKRRYLVTGDSYSELEHAQKNRYDDVINTFYNRQDESDYLSNGTIPGFFEKFGETVNGVTAADLSGNLTFYAIANYSSDVSSRLDDIKDVTGLQNFVVDIPTSGSVERNYFFMAAEESGVQLDAYEENGQVMVNQMLTTLRLRRLDAKITFNISVDIKHVEGTAVTFSNPTYKVHNIPNMSYLLERSKSNSSDSNTWDAAASQSGSFSCMLNDNYETIDNSLSFSFYIRENRPLPKKQITEAARTEENNNGKNYQNLYVMREAWDSENVTNPGYTKTPVHGRNFTYAPLNSTFVEISGNLNYTRKNEVGEDEIVAGNVTYIVHLGETGDAGDASNIVYVNNYDVRRNVRYIYNMSITGINSFEVEVTEEGEKRPGAEGDLSISDSKQFTLDAHYTRFMFELDKDSILRMLDGNKTQNAGWNVSSSPVGGTGYNAETGLIDGSSDYKWVLFAINKEFGYGDDEMVKFPGTQAYDGGVTFFLNNGNRKDDETLKKDIANDFGNNYPDDHTFKNSLSNDNFYYDKNIDDNACLRDINQLLKYLYKNASEDGGSLFNDDDRKVTITAFCDEYTYIYDPTRDNYIHPGTPLSESSDPERRLKFWKEFSNGRAGYVNAANRVMNITPMVATDISADGNTTITHSFVSISQLSIKTIYDENNASLDNAWGLETVNETGKLAEYPTNGSTQAPVGERGNTASDGRTNFINFWINDDGQGVKKWDVVMTTETSIDDETGIKPDYRDAYHACITRNRDLDGDNVIEKNEIFWYLAAKDQLVGLWLGQASLAEDAWLYDGDGTTKNHVVTSSYNGNNGPYNYYNAANFWLLWAEEGASWGKVKGDSETEQTYDYRCIRNLGINITNTDQSPSHYAIVDGPYNDESGNEYYTIDVSRINSRALRSSPDDGINLSLGHERSQYNQPFSSFDVLVEDKQAYEPNWGQYTFPWTTMRDWLNKNQNPCPNGWRVPNQREFLIMMSSLTNDYIVKGSPYRWGNLGYNLGIATSFSFNGMSPNYQNGQRYGFMYENGNLYLHNPKDTGKNLLFRCVRDHTGN